MPLIVRSLPKFPVDKNLLGKKIVDESAVPDPRLKDYPVSNVVFRSQLPENVFLLKQHVDKVSITGALDSGYIPLLVDDDNVVVQIV